MRFGSSRRLTTQNRLIKKLPSTLKAEDVDKISELLSVGAEFNDEASERVDKIKHMRMRDSDRRLIVDNNLLA